MARSFIFLPSSIMNCRSLRHAPGGSTAFSRHCNSRCVFVNVPAFSTCDAAGKKKTSVSSSSGSISPLATSGESFQNDADSLSTMSRTTSHFSFPRAVRSNFPFGAPIW